MKPVNQRVISNTNGDCFDACMVSILELDYFPRWEKESSQFIRWNEFLECVNLHVVYYELGSFPPPVGFSVLSVKSALFPGGRHAVVCESNGWWIKVVHNPNPQDPRGTEIPNSDWLGFSVVALIDPSKAMKR